MVIKSNKHSLITAFLNFIKYVRAYSLCIGIYVRGRKSLIEFQVSIWCFVCHRAVEEAKYTSEYFLKYKCNESRYI